jgi:alanine-glyoxylate transaminase / serine-glyoxylate transaminase / serine-pyruvate transaminase
MKNLLENIEEVLLMGPGPSSVPAEVYTALSRKTLGYLDAYLLQIMDELKEMLRLIMNTRNEVTFTLSGTGSAGMEAAYANLVEPGDKVLILAGGFFALRMQEVASRLGAKVDVLEFPWGTPILVEETKKKLQQESYKIVGMVHAETSTGVKNPVAEVGALLKGTDTLFVVDAVTSLGGTEIRMDDWSHGQSERAQDKSAELVPRPWPHSKLLGSQEGLPPHYALEYGLRPLPGPSTDPRRDAGEGLRSAR